MAGTPIGQRKASPPAVRGRSTGWSEQLRRFLEEYRVELAMAGAFALLCVVLSILAPNFHTERNIRNVLWQVTAIGIIAIGQTLVILTGGIDLSVGGIAAFSAMVGGITMNHTNVPAGIAATLLVGAGVGLANGLLVAYGRLAAFIVTLGMLSIANSLTYVISDASSIVGLPSGYRVLGRGIIGGVQYYLVIFVGLYALGHSS